MLYRLDTQWFSSERLSPHSLFQFSLPCKSHLITYDHPELSSPSAISVAILILLPKVKCLKERNVRSSHLIFYPNLSWVKTTGSVSSRSESHVPCWALPLTSHVTSWPQHLACATEVIITWLCWLVTCTEGDIGAGNKAREAINVGSCYLIIIENGMFFFF